MWTVVYLATGLDEAKKVEQKLTEEGFLVKVKLFSKECDEELYEILAPELETEEIQEVLYDLGYI